MQVKKIIEDIKKGVSETSKGELKKKATGQRWKIAQDSEKEYWSQYTTKALLERSGQRYPNKAKELLREWSEFIKVNKNIKILQIGSGPEDVINYVKIGQRYSIDPLAEFYKEHFDMDYKSSHLMEGRGEEIPFADEYFDVVLIINVLDHTQLPDKVLSEIKRVLKKKGVFHLENYIYQKKFIQLGKTFGKIRELFRQGIFNINHPYMFTLKDIKSLILRNFKILKERIGKDIGINQNVRGVYERLQKEQKFSRRLLGKIGLLGLINYTCICKKT